MSYDIFPVSMPMLKNSEVILLSTVVKNTSLSEQPALGILLTLAASQNK